MTSYTGFLKGTVVVITVAMAVLCAALSLTNGYKYFRYSERYVKIEMKTSVEGYGQVYFDTGLSYQEDASYRFEIRPTDRFETYRIPLPELTIKSIRFDPLDKKGTFEIKSVSIEFRNAQVVWDREKLVENIVPLQQIDFKNTTSRLKGFSTGEDPNFTVRGFVIPENRKSRTRTLIFIGAFMMGLAFIGVILFLMIDALTRSGHPEPRKTSPLLKYLQHIAICGLVFVIIGFYLWTATSNFKPFRFVIDGSYNDVYGLYTDLADALLAGRLSLIVEPSEALLSLPDPYDPEQNMYLRLHDASLFKGRYYLYFGPAPALLAFIPWKLLTGQPMPHNLAGAVFAVCGFVVSILLMTLIIRGTKLKGNLLIFLIGITMLGMCNMVLPVLRRPFMYEVASLSAYLWCMLSLFFIFSFMFFENRKIAHLLMAGLFYGLAIASRFSYVFGAVIFLIPLSSFLNHQKVFSRSYFKKIAVFLTTAGMPLALCIGLLLLYNYLRFENILEFGARYQLGIVQPLDHPFFSTQNFWVNNYLNLLLGVSINGSFPFFHVPSVNIPANLTIPSYYPIYWTKADPSSAGLLMNLPFLWIVIPAWIYLKLKKVDFPKPILYFALLLLLGGMANWLVVSLFSYQHMRYVIDFLPMILLLSCMIYFQIYDYFRGRIAGRVGVQCVAFTTVLYAVLANIGISIEGYRQIFEKGNPELYKKIEHIFDFIPDMISCL
jgi:hypothetical protein